MFIEKNFKFQKIASKIERCCQLNLGEVTYHVLRIQYPPQSQTIHHARSYKRID